VDEYSHELKPEARHYLTRISNSAERLDRLIQDVLNYSRIVNGELALEPVDPGPLLEEIIDSYPHLQKAKGHIVIEKPLPAVMANRAALTQVISNLLGNAVKFVAPGVEPSVIVRAENSREKVRFWIEDNGIGIEPQAQKRIFQLFQRLHRPELYEGTGLGLAIVRKSAERMGGAVGVESEPGKGSRFWFELKPAKVDHVCNDPVD
jgi:signal transduction histidine kinase